jgi:hypothetical protein
MMWPNEASGRASVVMVKHLWLHPLIPNNKVCFSNMTVVYMVITNVVILTAIIILFWCFLCVVSMVHCIDRNSRIHWWNRSRNRRQSLSISFSNWGACDSEVNLEISIIDASGMTHLHLLNRYKGWICPFELLDEAQHLQPVKDMIENKTLKFFRYTMSWNNRR